LHARGKKDIVGKIQNRFCSARYVYVFKNSRQSIRDEYVGMQSQNV